MRINWDYYKPIGEDFDGYIGLAMQVLWPTPYYFGSLLNKDGSFRQSDTHKRLVLNILIWNIIVWIEIAYKRVTLPKKFPKPRYIRKKFRKGQP